MDHQNQQCAVENMTIHNSEQSLLNLGLFPTLFQPTTINQTARLKMQTEGFGHSTIKSASTTDVVRTESYWGDTIFNTHLKTI